VALTLRLATNAADLALINTLFSVKVPLVTGQSIIDELFADFGGVIPFTLTFWLPILADPNARVVMGFQPANTLRGACYWAQEGDAWVCRLVGIDKSLTAAQRLDGAKDFFREAANRVPSTTEVRGVLKLNGKLDTWLRPQLPASDFIPWDTGMVLVKTTAGRLALVA
jgi:hypothetical protein